MTRTYDMPQGAKDALAADPVDYIKRWWMNHSTADERKAAIGYDFAINVKPEGGAK